MNDRPQLSVAEAEVSSAQPDDSTGTEARNSLSTTPRCRWTELAQLDKSDPPMLLEGLLPTTEIALLAGTPGLGKSTLSRELAVSVVSGKDTFLGLRLNAKHRRVLYVACEDGTLQTARILERYSAQMSEGLEFIWGGRLTLKEILEEIDTALDEGPADLVVIDSLGNIFKGEQNSNSDIQAFFSKFAEVAERTCVLFLHHLRKAGHGMAPDQVHIQGGGAFVQRARCVLMLTGPKHQSTRFLHCEKENDVSDLFKQEALVLDFDSNSKSYRATGERLPVSEIKYKPEPTDSRRIAIDWIKIFGECEELGRGDLVERIKTQSGLAERQADKRIKDELTLLRYGIYRRPTG
jgi:archaellum biogenesis ATPase FlaH